MSKLQPQGVSIDLHMSVSTPIAVEFVEDGQITLPSKVRLLNLNANMSPLIVNGGLLRTHLDVFHIVTTPANADVNLRVLVAKQPITDFPHQKDYPNVNFAADYTLAIPKGEVLVIELRRIDGEYIMSHQKSPVTPDY